MRMRALDYKVRYAESSLQYLSKEYRRREMKAGPDGLMVPEPVPEEVVFHIDVFFSFMASALDFSGWILHLVFSTKLAETEIGLVNLVSVRAANLCRHLCSFFLSAAFRTEL
jgi:hypothetical protein